MLKNGTNKGGRLGSIFSWIFSHKKFAIGVMALMIAVPAVSATVLHFEHSGVGLTTSRGPLQYETYVNASVMGNNNIPLYIGNHYYTSSNITNYKAKQAGNATISLPGISGFTNGGYIAFTVTIKNTGTSTLYLNTTSNQLMYADYFVNSAGQYETAAQAGLNTNKYFDGTGGTYVTTSWGFGDNFQNFQGYLASGPYSINWVSDWYSSSPHAPSQLTAGQSYSFTIITGLGADSPANLPAQYFSLAVPVTLTA